MKNSNNSKKVFTARSTDRTAGNQPHKIFQPNTVSEKSIFIRYCPFKAKDAMVELRSEWKCQKICDLKEKSACKAISRYL